MIEAMSKLPEPFAVERKMIEAIPDLELLGLWVFIEKAVYFETVGLQILIELIIKQFGLEQEYILDKMKKLESMGLLYVGKEK